jgi:isopenicillin N synthase-like dioxygenase
MKMHALHEIAVVDLSSLGRPGGTARVGAALGRALEDVGFFILVNHGVAHDLIAGVFDQARRFHAQPGVAKRALLMNSHNNGYMAMARYNVRTSRVSEAAKPDMNEAFFLKRERPADDPLALSGRRFAGPNQWPQDLPGFKSLVLDYADALDGLAKRLLGPLASALGLPGDTFSDAFRESQFSLRLSHYPPVERVAGQYGIAPHTDVNFLTLLAQSEVPGLQIRHDAASTDSAADGESSATAEHWTDVPYIANSFVVNAGDTLHRWTNGRFKSTAHRALPPLNKARYAVPFFLGPHLDTTIRCLPSCTDEAHPPKYSPTTYGDYLDWWYDANYNASDQQDLAVAR